MAVITSVKVGASNLELISSVYDVAHSTLLQLTAMTPRQARMVDMQARHPAFVGTTPQSRPLTIDVMMLEADAQDRRDAWQALIDEFDVEDTLVPVQWTEGSTTYKYWVVAQNAIASAWFQRGSVECVVPDPVAATV